LFASVLGHLKAMRGARAGRAFVAFARVAQAVLFCVQSRVESGVHGSLSPPEAQMITQELLAKLRLENVNVLARVDQLRVRAESEGTPALAHEVAMLRRELRDYVGLVDALVDALLPDAPRTRKAG
jgi:hypothetical protein